MFRVPLLFVAFLLSVETAFGQCAVVIEGNSAYAKNTSKTTSYRVYVDLLRQGKHFTSYNTDLRPSEHKRMQGMAKAFTYKVRKCQKL